jgi:hypothetical protein
MEFADLDSICSKGYLITFCNSSKGNQWPFCKLQEGSIRLYAYNALIFSQIFWILHAVAEPFFTFKRVLVGFLKGFLCRLLHQKLNSCNSVCTYIAYCCISTRKKRSKLDGYLNCPLSLKTVKSNGFRLLQTISYHSVLYFHYQINFKRKWHFS